CEEGGDDGAGPYLIPARECRLAVVRYGVGQRFCFQVFDLQGCSVPYMGDKRGNKDNAPAPDKDRQGIEGYDIGVEFVEEYRGIPGYVEQDEDAEDLSRDRHHDFSADRGCGE